jgi:hypothetical protein
MPKSNDTLTVDKLYDSMRKIKSTSNNQSTCYTCNPCARGIKAAPILKPRSLGMSTLCVMPESNLIDEATEGKEENPCGT